mgnify:CR=1 FL=1
MQTRAKKHRLESEAARAQRVGVVPQCWDSIDSGLLAYIIEQVRACADRTRRSAPVVPHQRRLPSRRGPNIAHRTGAVDCMRAHTSAGEMPEHRAPEQGQQGSPPHSKHPSHTRAGTRACSACAPRARASI